jgi:hypothetical protein
MSIGGPEWIEPSDVPKGKVSALDISAFIAAVVVSVS